jgi:hypothetical protein
VELRHRQPRALRQAGAGGPARAAALRARRDHPRGPGAGGHAFRRTPGGSRPLCLAGDARAGAAGARGLHRRTARWLRTPPGRAVAGRAHALALAALQQPEPQAAERARGGGGGRGGLPGRARAAGQRGRLHPPDPRLARVRARHLLDADARLPGAQRTAGRRGPAGLLLDRRYRHGLPARRAHADPAPGLCAPHPAPDADRPLRTAAGRAAAAIARLVPGGLRRRGRMGRAAQHPGHEPVRGRRPDGQQALHRQRRLHRTHERRQPVQPLPLQAQGARAGASACPFTTLYWDFLLRHEARLAANPRTVMQVRNLARLDEAERQAIRRQAGALRSKTADPGAAAAAEAGP